MRQGLLPGCMIGPSEPCDAFTAELARLKKALEELVTK
jgi:hypothetical protein